MFASVWKFAPDIPFPNSDGIFRVIEQEMTLNIPSLLGNGISGANFQTEANIFNDYFIEQCLAILTGSSFLTLALKPYNVLET